MSTSYPYTRVRDLDRWGFGQQADDLIEVAAEIGRQLAGWNGGAVNRLEREAKRQLKALTASLEAQGLPWQPAMRKLKDRCAKTVLAVQVEASGFGDDFS